MLGIDSKLGSHRLAIHTSVKQVAQGKRKLGEEKRVVIDEEVGKLSNNMLITEIKYPPG